MTCSCDTPNIFLPRDLMEYLRHETFSLPSGGCAAIKQQRNTLLKVNVISKIFLNRKITAKTAVISVGCRFWKLNISTRLYKVSADSMVYWVMPWFLVAVVVDSLCGN